jgi:hypothetical protein
MEANKTHEYRLEEIKIRMTVHRDKHHILILRNDFGGEYKIRILMEQAQALIHDGLVVRQA